MRGFPNRPLSVSLFLVGLALPAFAQNSNDSVHVPSFLPPGVGDVPSPPGFSGLAVDPKADSAQPATTAPAPSVPAAMPAPAPAPAPPTVQALLPASPPSAASSAPAPASVLQDVNASAVIPPPVVVAALPNVSPESIGLVTAEGFGVDGWKGTPHAVAERLLWLLAPTASPVLNNLAFRMLAASSVPPEGEPETPQAFMAARIEKLVLLGRWAEAWALASQASAKVIDASAFHAAAENAVANGDPRICQQIGEIAKNNPGADWQELMIVCKLQSNDLQAAQVALDVLRSQNNRDNVFLGVAEKLVSGAVKSLPFQLTPLTPPTVALLKLAKLPLPASLFARADTSFMHAMLHIPAQQDVAKLALAERAAERALVDTADLSAAYREIAFAKEALASPLSSSESGLRLRALLFNAAELEKEPQKRMAYALRFFQTAAPSIINSTGVIAAQMLGDIKADPAFARNAPTFARIYMIAGKGDLALDWLRLAQGSSVSAEELQLLWPQFVLGGLESDASYRANFDRWFAAAIQTADAQALRDVIAPTLLYLDVVGFHVPDVAWLKAYIASENEKKAAFSPIFLERLNVAASAGRRAETVVLAALLAGNSEASLPVGLAVAKALRQAGFQGEAATFARQAVASLGKN